MTITGLNHVTLAVGDLARATRFYTEVLGARQHTTAPKSVYLSLGTLWLCLEHAKTVTPRKDDTHIAFSCKPDDFDALAARISAHAAIWKDNRSEGASLYFLDPDDHRLELHVGDLHSRLAHYHARPEKGVTVIDPD